MSFFKRDETTTTATGVKVSNVREEAPLFCRLYSARVTDEVRIEVTAKTIFGSRSWFGELTQRNGSTVWFEPDRVAEKILDHAMVPLIEAFCTQFFALDKEYMHSPRLSFVDEKGTVWTRQA